MKKWPPEKFVELDGEFAGTCLHYIDRGENKSGISPIVLVHGASGNLRDMEISLVPLLEKHTRVIAFDRPGHGWSSRGKSAEMADPASQAKAIHMALRKIGIEKPVLLGHSWGGAVAAAYALSFPDELSGVVPLSAALYPWDGGVAWYHSISTLPVFGPLFISLIARPASRFLLDQGVRRNFHPELPPEDYAERTALPLLFRVSEFRANSQDVMRLNAHLARQSVDYPSLGVPCVIITGNADYTLSPKRNSYAFYNAVPGAELVKLKGAGHMPHHTRGAIIADVLLRLARGEKPRAGIGTFHANGTTEFAARD